MGREDQIVQERVKKLNELRKLGINPYAHRFEKKDNSIKLQEKYSKLNSFKELNYAALIGVVDEYSTN